MPGRLRKGAFAAVAAGAVAIGIPVAAVAHDRGHDGGHHHRHQHAIKHVLLISVDGLHQSDLEWYVAHHPGSELARLAGGGNEYSSAQTPVPSDSDPGMTAQMTGGNPQDDRASTTTSSTTTPCSRPGTTSCHGQATGADVIYDSPDDINDNSLDAGQGLSGLPGSILNMTSTPQDLLDPVDVPGRSDDLPSRSPPAQYLKVNTIFNVAHDAGLLTAWSDKHPVYTSFNGPEGNGITDSFDPEIDSIALKPDGTPYPGNISWTGDNAATMQYDSYKVQAVLNWIDGYNHSRTQQVGVPAIFGMNFQTVSTAEKLPTSDGLAGGYLPGHDHPGAAAAASAPVRQRSAADDGPGDPVTGPGRLDGDCPLRQARAVPAGPQPADPDRRRSDHRRRQRRMGGRSSRSRSADLAGNRRRRGHVVAVRSIPAGRPVRQALPVDAHRHRQHRRGRHADAAALRPGRRSTPARRRLGTSGCRLQTRVIPTCGASSRSGVVYTGGKGKIAEHGGV